MQDVCICVSMTVFSDLSADRKEFVDENISTLLSVSLFRALQLDEDVWGTIMVPSTHDHRSREHTKTLQHTQLEEPRRDNGTGHFIAADRSVRALLLPRYCGTVTWIVQTCARACFCSADESADVLLLETLQHLCSSVQNLYPTYQHCLCLSASHTNTQLIACIITSFIFLMVGKFAVFLFFFPSIMSHAMSVKVPQAFSDA